nr:reverse transcriptase [Solanum melongena]WMB97160.1 reverse transcriptase [Solanum aethiopicum]
MTCYSPKARSTTMDRSYGISPYLWGKGKSEHIGKTNRKKLVQESIPWSLLFGFICWYIWNWRNKCLFVQDFTWPSNAFHVVLVAIFATGNTRMKLCLHHLLHVRFNTLDGFIHLMILSRFNVDAAAKTNPGEIAAGGLCRDTQGSWLFGFTRKLGWGPITKAELYAIYSGLSLAWSQGYRKVILESDSLVAVSKILQPLKDSDPLFSIIHACKELLHRNWSVSIVHVYREANTCADRMANLAHKGPFDLSLLLQPPSYLAPYLQEDLLGVSRPRSVVFWVCLL